MSPRRTDHRSVSVSGARYRALQHAKQCHADRGELVYLSDFVRQAVESVACAICSAGPGQSCIAAYHKPGRRR